MRPEKNEELERLRSYISHSFKTPLAIISGYGDILLNSDIAKDEKSREYLKKICENTQYLSIMVDRSLIQIVEKRSEPVCELKPMNLVELIKKMDRNIEKLLSQNGITLRIDAENEEVLILGDRIQLENLLNNLFDNAIKYMMHSGYIDISVERKDDKVFLIYADNGEGMKAEETQKIFDACYQGSNGRLGAGNGMCLVKKIINAHNAEIQVISDYNQGMKIKMTFPTYNDNL